MTSPSPGTEQAWTRLQRAQHHTLTEVERALKAAGFPALVWYDVLLELDRAGGDGLRPFELEGLLLLPQYGVSRLLERMEGQGLLRRVPHRDDRRGRQLQITGQGRQLRKRMWPVYAAAIEKNVGRHLCDGEAETLARLLEKLLPPRQR